MGTENFSDIETWVWDQIKDGKPANLNEHFGRKDDNPLDPKSPDGWENRILRDGFRAELRKHLAEQETQSARKKVCIIGACVQGEAIVEIGNFIFLHEFSLEKCRIEVDVCLPHVHSLYGISLHGSYMKKLDLSHAKIEGFLDLSGITCDGPAEMDRIEVGHDLDMRRSEFKSSLLLSKAKVDRSLDMSEMVVCGKELDMDGVEVGRDLILVNLNAGHGEYKTAVKLNRANIGRQFNMTGAKCGSVDMTRIEVERDLVMIKATLESIQLESAKILGSLDMTNAKCGSVKLPRIEVERDLVMINGTLESMQLESAKILGSLDMTNAKCGIIVNMPQMEVGHDLKMSLGEWGEVDLKKSKIGGSFDMVKASKCDLLNMGEAKVDGSVVVVNLGNQFFLINATVHGEVVMEECKFEEADLTEAKIDGKLIMRRGATWKKTLNLKSVDIKGDVEIHSGTGEGNEEVTEEDHDVYSKEHTKSLSLLGAKIGGDLIVTGALQDLTLSEARVHGSIKLDHEKDKQGNVKVKNSVIGKIDMKSLVVGQNLNMPEGNAGVSLDMDGVAIGGDLTAVRQRYQSITLCRAKIGKDLNLDGSVCDGLRLSLSEANIGGNLELNQATIHKLDMESIGVGKDLNLQGSACDTLILSGANIGGNLLLNQGTFIEVDMDSIRVEGDAKFSATFGNKSDQHHFQIKAPFAHIAGNLSLRDAHFYPNTTVDLKDTHVKGYLDIFKLKPAGEGGARTLILQNTVVAVLKGVQQTEWDNWKLDLFGFTYTRLENDGAELSGKEIKQSGIKAKLSRWWKKWWEKPNKDFTKWLKQDSGKSPQPYHQLASVLRTQGELERANDILFAQKQRERSEATNFTRHHLWLFLLDWSIGYGYRYIYTIGWILFFTLAGCLLLKNIDATNGWSGDKIFWASLDQLLPIIDLDEKFKFISFNDNEWLRRGLFYAEKLLGYALGVFVVAGVTGLTKK